MPKTAKNYTVEFKHESAHLAQTSGKPFAQVARELDISESVPHLWRKQLSEHGNDVFPGSGHHKPHLKKRTVS